MTEYKGKKNTEKEVAHVIRHIREMLERGEVIPGERLPAGSKPGKGAPGPGKDGVLRTGNHTSAVGNCSF